LRSWVSLITCVCESEALLLRLGPASSRQGRKGLLLMTALRRVHGFFWCAFSPGCIQIVLQYFNIEKRNGAGLLGKSLATYTICNNPQRTGCPEAARNLKSVFVCNASLHFWRIIR